MNSSNTSDTKYLISEIYDNRQLTKDTFVLKFDKKNFKFKAGQHIAIGLPNSIEHREYSIYNGENDDYLELLIKRVESGTMSKKIQKLKAGDKIKVISPVGYFTICSNSIKSKKFVFIATGTGIAPYHSFIKTYKKLDYKILHGISYHSEAYDKEHYDKSRYIACTSKDKNGDFNGRVTDYLKQSKINKDAIYYLCGNYEMIDEVHSILINNGIDASNIHSEVYF